MYENWYLFSLLPPRPRSKIGILVLLALLLLFLCLCFSHFCNIFLVFGAFATFFWGKICVFSFLRRTVSHKFCFFAKLLKHALFYFQLKPIDAPKICFFCVKSKNTRSQKQTVCPRNSLKNTFSLIFSICKHDGTCFTEWKKIALR